MTKNRLEAFSDGVIAILITIMVLELHAPHGDSLWDLLPLWPVFISYILSFVHIGIYWNNHHHMLHAIDHVNGRVLWANMHLLFWISLIPFATAWMGENHFACGAVVLYGLILLASGCAYRILAVSLVRAYGEHSTIARALGADQKGKWSIYLYCMAIAVCFLSSWISCAIYAAVAAMWLVPDRRFEKARHS